ncbi:MAG TPA: aldo/keto reductase, partial [Gammaproteobacteria bacterium]|nr:aldo/keto reductase [Gammaproteobacteria bacterium]
MLTRRRYLQLAAAVCAVAGGRSARVLAQSDARSGAITRHAIPSTGEEIPIIGLGSSASFQRLADSGESEAIRAVMEALLDGGGTVFDTAPSYGSAEAVAGRLVGEMNARDRVF